jgi:two-component system CheB/CheR fusion protein
MSEATCLPLLRVLVVDDCADTIQSLGMLLRLWGHEACLTRDGPTALEAVRTWQPDVVLPDLEMPGMDGWELTRRLRSEGKLDGALIIAITGYGRQEDQLRSRAAGCNHHLVKPVPPEVLAELLAARQQELACAGR